MEIPFKLVMAMAITRAILASPEKWEPELVDKARYFCNYMEKKGIRYWGDPDDTLPRFERNCVPWKEILEQLPDNYRERLAGE